MLSTLLPRKMLNWILSLNNVYHSSLRGINFKLVMYMYMNLQFYVEFYFDAMST